MPKRPFKIIQITDTHLMASEEAALLGVKTQHSLRLIIDHIKNNEQKVDSIILTGDLSQDGSLASYEMLSELVSQVNVPTYFVPGNHDNPDILTQAFPLNMVLTDRHIQLGNWQLVLLDSQVVPEVQGRIGEIGLNFLQMTLEKHPDHYTIVGLHHPPVAVGSAWLDNINLENKEAFWVCIEGFQNVKLVISGHVHQENEIPHGSCKALTTPSTCFQFKSKSEDFALEELPPGYRWINLYDDGRYETGVVRLPEYIGEFDRQAHGY